MATRFSDDEVREILQRAIDRNANHGGSTGSAELMEIAAELGVSQDDVSAAIAEVTQGRELQREVAAIQEERRHSLRSSVATWFLVCSMLLLVDWMTGPGWWVMWPCAIWGFILVLLARRAYFPNRRKLEYKARSRLGRRLKRQERERRRRRQRGIEEGLEQAFERGVAALVAAAARHVERVTAQPGPPPAPGRQRVEPMPNREADPAFDEASDEMHAAKRWQKR